jgi:hypothetical protein
VQALRKHSKSARGEVLKMLPASLPDAPEYLHSAIASLVNGGAVELIVGHCAKAGWEQDGAGVEMLVQFFRDPQGQERMAVQETVEQLMKAVAKWLLEVSDLLVMGIAYWRCDVCE